MGKKLIAVEGERLSLDDIEQRILRPIWRDPRLHCALVCGSVGWPYVQPTAFTGANADGLLDRSARDYVNHPRGARLVGGRLIVSRVHAWCREDFGDSDADVIVHLQRYADPERRRDLARVKRISGYAYDWAPNDAPRRAGQRGTR